MNLNALNPTPLHPVSPEQASKALAGNLAVQLIDVREPGEFKSEHIDGAVNLPMSSIDAALSQVELSKPVYLVCQSGSRAESVAAKLFAKGHTEIYLVSGGLTAWKAAQLPTVIGARRLWSMERQVRFAAGSLILTGLGLSLVSPYFLLISAFVGGGLVFSGLTGWCGMALLLARLPWNR
jgi:rhodanese-related sulfurtransferase